MVILVVALIAGAIGGIVGAATTIAGIMELQDWKDKQLQAARAKRARARVVSAEVKPQRLLEDAASHERKRKREERTAARRAKEQAKHDEAERKREEEERKLADKAKADAEDRARAERAMIEWKEERVTKKPTAERAAAAVEERKCAQYHRGQYLHVFALVSPAGVSLEWKVESSTSVVPYVNGFCDDVLMFVEYGFAGAHTTVPSPGRHELSFRVHPGGRISQGIDLFFEVFIPHGKSPRAKDDFKKNVAKVTKEFVDRQRTVAKAKRTVHDTLAAHTNDPDESIVEMAKFDSAINDLERRD